MSAHKKELPPGVPEAQTPIPGGIDEKPPPKFGTGKTISEAGTLPREVAGLDRAPSKGKAPFRFKIRCNNYHPQKTRYILANDEASAVECYKKINGLDKTLERLKKLGGQVEEPDVIVTQLED